MNFEEKKAEILRRSQARIAKRSRSRRIVLGIVTPVILVAILSVPALYRMVPWANRSSESLLVNPGNASGVPENALPMDGNAGATVPETVDETNTALAENHLVINPLLMPPSSADMDVQIERMDFRDPQVQQAFVQFTGRPLEALIASLPGVKEDTLALYTFCARSSLDGPYAVHDYVLQYTAQDGSQARIALSALGKPLRDCLFIADGSDIPSQVQGVQVLVYGYEGFRWATFSCGGLFFDVEAQDMTADPFLELLCSLIQ